MAIPDFQLLMLPVLKETAVGEMRISDVVAVLGTKTKISLTDGRLSPSARTFRMTHSLSFLTGQYRPVV